MKTFQVQGCYNLNGQKYFKTLEILAPNNKEAIAYFKDYFELVFYKVNLIQLK